MEFIADLHLHSHFSRATAKNLDIENLYTAAQLKGITLVGTGDFTHPGWLAEIEDKLEPDESGLLRLKPDLAQALDSQIPPICRHPVRFILQAEISSIYKRDDRVRKNHNLLYLPDIETVKKLNTTLAGIGNLTSDGRPILGLDAEKLLEIMLDTSAAAFMIPAHIWTPWFSLFGSKSGFDTIRECFGALSDHIFAAETGLSSNPPMNWRIQDLDTVTLVSNSDAHSPMMMGRNASSFNTELSFLHVRKALESGDPDAYRGTIDMYPEEGKYHYDGHRKCNICFAPSETLAHQGICPVCNTPLTLGVLYRANQLATRPHGYTPTGRQGFRSIIPLTDILAEISGVGPKSKKVTTLYTRAIETLGPELDILLSLPIDAIDKAKIPLLAEAVAKMRSGDVEISPGFDGEYGKVHLFTSAEKHNLKGEQDLFPHDGTTRIKKRRPVSRPVPGRKNKATGTQESAAQVPVRDESGGPYGLNPEQQQALSCNNTPLLIQAGPGTGKTRTLTAKIAWLISEKMISPGAILALTFTNRAAAEMKERIALLVPDTSEPIHAMTFHALCLMLLRDFLHMDPAVADEEVSNAFMQQALEKAGFKKQPQGPSRNEIIRAINAAKQSCISVDSAPALFDSPDHDRMASAVWGHYQDMLAMGNRVDFEDLISTAYHGLLADADTRARLNDRFTHIFVDEYQDINHGQYLLTRLLAGDGNTLFAIGDPDQSIYGFRGSSNTYFNRFLTDYPAARKIVLTKNYRSTQTILDASFQIISKGENDTAREKLFSDITSRQQILIQEAASDAAEAVAVGKKIERLVGGLSLFSFDSGAMDAPRTGEYSFSDIAVLFRTGMQARIFARVFAKAGIPFQAADRKTFFDTPCIREVTSLAKLASGRGILSDFETAFRTVSGIKGKKLPAALTRWVATCQAPFGTVLERLAAQPPPGMRADMQQQVQETAGQILLLKEHLKDLDPAASLKAIADRSGLGKTIDADTESREMFDLLVHKAAGVPGTLGDFLDTLVLNNDPDTLVPGAEKVSLMTMHAAKGLEFPVTFVTGCESGLIPFAYPGRRPADPEEERRLFYVAATRARDILCLTYARKRRIFNSIQEQERSPFLDDIENQLKHHDRILRKPPALSSQERQLDLFAD